MKLFITTALLTVLSFGAAAQTDSTQTEGIPYYPMMDYDAAAKKYIINDVKVSGIKVLDPRIIIATSGIRQGDTITLPGDYLTSAVRKMWNQRYYSNVQILTETEGDSINLEIVLTERQKVTDWRIQGASKIEEKELIEQKLKLRRGSELSDYALHTSRDIIIEYYKEKGFSNVRVNLTQVNDPVAQNSVIVSFVVDKGNKIRIKKISFENNDNISDGKLRRSFKKIHQTGINFVRNTKLKAKEYEEDKEGLIDFYASRGFRNAAIVSDSIYQINDRRIGIDITVDEGKMFYFNDITWTGNSVYPTEMLNDLLGIEKGDPYDRKGLNERLGIGKEVNYDDPSAISSLYQNEGYLFSDITPDETIVGVDSVNLDIKIFEGKQATINEVNISGNFRVDDDVVRRELYVRPGELYNRALLMQSARQLSQMGHFLDEKTFPQFEPVGDDRINLNYSLEDKASDQIEISAGWGYGMFVGSVGLSLNNFSLKRTFKKGAWSPYPAGQNQKLSLKAQTNGSYYKALSMSFMEPWLGGKKPNSFSLSMYYSSENDAYYAWQAGDKYFRTLGAAVGIGKRLSWPDRNFTLYTEIGFQAYMLKDWDNFLISNGTSKMLTFKTVFGRNTVNQQMFPSRGSDFSISMTLTPPYSLFQNINYADPNLSDNKRYGWIEYHKWKLKAQWYYPITSNEKLVLMAKAELGYIGAYNKNKRSPFEGFDVGGDGMSTYTMYGVDIIGLRGYDNGTLTPFSANNNEYASAFNKYTVELRYPLLVAGQQVIYALAFVEGGNGFRNWKEFDPFNIKRSAGVGVRVFLPFLGMIGFDWGYGFDGTAANPTKRSGGQPHFVIGMDF